MLRFILFSLIILSSYILKSQEFTNKISFDSFKKWSKYTKVFSEKDKITYQENGYKEQANISYLAKLNNGYDILIITLGQEKDFEGYKYVADTGTYKLIEHQGFKAVYYPLVSEAGMYCFVSVLIPEINATLTFSYSRVVPIKKILPLISNFRIKDLLKKLPGYNSERPTSLSWWWGFNY